VEGADYPLLLTPHLAERIWGGRRLGHHIGEAWDLSVHPGGPSTIRNGPLANTTLGDAAQARPEDFGGPIRLLAKRLDCAHDLSVQVHPKRGDPKTECWVVLDVRRGAGVYLGFDETQDQETIRAAARDGSLPHLLRFFPLEKGACVFVPSGTVHAIGGGLFLFELQQSSDTTYRLFDWGRGRRLHLEKGIACADTGPAPPPPEPRSLDAGRTRLVDCEHFYVDRVGTDERFSLDPGGTWTAALIVAGRIRMEDTAAEAGDTLLLPRAAGRRDADPEGLCEVLVYGPTRSNG